jgi:hypothetical protein
LDLLFANKIDRSLNVSDFYDNKRQEIREICSFLLHFTHTFFGQNYTNKWQRELNFLLDEILILIYLTEARKISMRNKEKQNVMYILEFQVMIE